MKKALIALAVLGAASGAAMAQSSVTLYGVADIAIGKAASGGDSKWGAQTNTIVTNGTSRIGLTGKEDLGGGLWAGFRYEMPVNLANGQEGSATGSGSGWNREANVMLGSNMFGTVKLGRSTTPTYDGQGIYELTGWANYSVVANTFGYGANPDPRNNAQIEYITPSFYGISAALSYVPKAEGVLVDGANPTNQNNRADRWDFNLAYNQGPLKAAFTIDKPTNITPSTYVNAAGATVNRRGQNRANWTLGGSYTFANVFALAVSYNQANNAMAWRQSSTCAARNVYLCGGQEQFGAKRYGWELGGSVFLGAFTVTLDLTRDTKNQLYNGHKYTNGVLEAKYALSKRTFLYADYLRLDSDNNYGVGLRHNF